MLPYLAILTDSFRAAFASRVLWIVLASLVVVLLALAPIGYREVYTVDFNGGDVNSAERLTDLLARSLSSTKASAAQNVAKALPDELREQVIKGAESGEQLPRRGEYADALNNLIKDDSWYDADLWKQVARFGELKELDAQDASTMETRLVQRRSRLRIEAALPGAFRPRPERSLKITYAVFETPFDLPIRRQRFVELLNQTIFPLILNNLFGIGAVFVGILVTSPIIPEMFQPGSLHLLLSKPISRPALYLSKFVGGCAFVLLCETLLIFGLWLIAGFRLDIWNHRLFYCIPVFVFLFAVYYSVSALAALQWRSPIVSIAITVLFWFGCFLVGIAGGVAEGFVTEPAKIRSMVASKGTVFTATNSGNFQEIGESDRAYLPLITATFGTNIRILGPVRMLDDRIVAAKTEFNPFNPLGADNAALLIYDPQQSWKELPGLKLPRGTTQLLPAPDGGILVATNSGLLFAPADKLLVDATAEEAADKPADSGGLFSGLQKLLTKNTEEFTAVLPATITLSSPSEVVLANGSKDLVVYSAGTLYWLSKDVDGPGWSEHAQLTSEGDNTLETSIAATKDAVFLARKGEPLRIYNSAELKMIGEIPTEETNSIARLVSSPNGQHVVAQFADHSLALIPGDGTASMETPSFPRQGNIESICFDEAGNLWLAHDIDRLTLVDVSTAATLQQRKPARDLWRNVDAWIIAPIRYIVPQTGEVSEVVISLISGSKNLEINIGDQTQRVQLNVVRPVATCLGFTVVMLLLGCFYVHRQDF